MRRIATWCFRHRWMTVIAWLAALVALVAVHSAVGSAYTDNFRLPHTGSFDAIALLQRASPRHAGETDQLVIAVDHGRVTDAAVRARAQRLFAQVARLPYVASVSSPYTPRGRDQIAPGGRVAFAAVTFTNAANHDDVTATMARRFDTTITSASGRGVQFQAEGNIAETGNPSTQDSSLEYGFLAAAIVLFVAFGSFVATLLPLVCAGVSLGAGLSVVGLLSHVLETATFSGELALLIGLGVGVDYALFIVTRYKQALRRGASREEATVEGIDTSGRAVLFAGIIVCIAMLGMLALGVSFLYGVAIAAAVTVAFTVAASITLLPALLGIAGGLAPRRRERRELRQGTAREAVESPLWARWGEAVGRRPALLAVVTGLLMVVLSLPFLSMRLGSADAGTDPANTTTRKAYDLLARGFGPGYSGPLMLVAQVNGAGQVAAFKQVEQAVARMSDVAGSTPVAVLAAGGERPTVATASIFPRGSPQAPSTTALLRQVRGTVIPATERGSGLHVLVGGRTAVVEDFSRVLSAKLPLFVGVVVAVSFLLLLAVFRSFMIPLTAAVMNILSAGAAFGVVTAVFQLGWVGGSTGPIETFVPVLMFPILFGLSMDYEVFLISRIYEEWHRHGDNRAAVTHGLAATGRTISAAGAIMVLVFASFVLGGERVIELFGVGLATAVALDALLVRSMLVPALMIVIGEVNWKLPAWLNRRLPRLNVEGRAVHPRPRAEGPKVAIEPSRG